MKKYNLSLLLSLLSSICFAYECTFDSEVIKNFLEEKEYKVETIGDKSKITIDREYCREVDPVVVACDMDDFSFAIVDDQELQNTLLLDYAEDKEFEDYLTCH